MVCDRKRSAVRLRVTIDGKSALDSTFPPKGLWGDGASIAMERIPVELGEHEVRVAIGDTPDPDEWSYETTATIHFTDDARRVLSFDRLEGFSWH